MSELEGVGAGWGKPPLIRIFWHRLTSSRWLFSKAGAFTVEEFEVALDHYRQSKRPYILTFFKSGAVDTLQLRREDVESLFDFKERLSALGHYYTKYRNLDELKLAFRGQLDLLLDTEF